MEQPAHRQLPPSRTAPLIGCPEAWCELYWIDLVDGEIEYVLFDQEFYLWRGEGRERLPAGFSREDELPDGVAVTDETIYLHDQPLLTFAGTSGPQFSVGYYPRAISPNGRFLAFYYPGYSDSDRWFLAHLLGFAARQGGNDAIETATKAIYRLPGETHLRWQ